MRILIAAFIGGLVMFVWGVVAHMVLPIGEMGMHQPRAEDVVLTALPEGLGDQTGLYILPSLSPEKMRDKAAMKAYGEKAASSPYAFIVYQPQGSDMTQMGPQIATQWVSDTLAALLAAFALALAGPGFGRRVALAGGIGLFSWLSISVPYWNWYRFPLDFTIGQGAEQVIGWLLAGAAMAWWLGRRGR